MTTTPPKRPADLSGRFAPRVFEWRATAGYGLALAAVALTYFAFAELGLAVASINPSASPIWAPSGIALAAVMLVGYRIWPAIFVAAFAANITTAGTLGTSLAIALGNTLEALITAALINRLSHGRATFETATGVVRFAALCLGPGALVSATFGVGSLTLAGFAEGSSIFSIWLTWWMGNTTGAVIVAPVVVLWATAPPAALRRDQLAETGWIVGVAVAVGVLAYSPLLEQTMLRGPLSFLAILPLILAALRRGPRDTATVALVLSAFAVWGTFMDAGPFSQSTLNDSFLMLLAFIISISVPSLVLGAEVAMRRAVERDLRDAHRELDARIKQRTSELGGAIEALQAEVEERREIEIKLQEQHVHLLEAQRLANLGSWSWDIRSGRVTWSQQIYEIYGADPKSFKGNYEDYITRVHPDDRERIQAAIAASLRTRARFQVEERIVRPDGEIRHLQSTGEIFRDEAGEPLRMLGICRDVTDHKKAEAELRLSEERYRLLVESVHDYAIVLLDPRGHIMSWNAGAARINQYSEDEALGRHFKLFYTEEDRAQDWPAHVLNTAASGKFEEEGWRLRKDGSRFWASVIVDPIFDEAGTLLGFAKVTRDITERRASQIALEEAREQLAQAQKMEALGQLTGGIAHDFNNLLMIVSGHAQILRRNASDEKARRAIDAIATAASRGENLTRQLLAFSRRQPLSPVVVNLGERIVAVREMLGSSLRGNIELIVDIPDDLWPTETDLSELELALVNIAVNARDALPEGGTVTLAARNVTLRRDQPPGDLDGDFVALSMTDTGTGIPRDTLPKVFEPFFTTKAVGKGTGLGLSQVYGFAQSSGGAVTVKSEVGHGTTVTIYLARSHARVANAGDDPRFPPPASGSGTILLVEDNPDVGDVSSSLLSQLGYRIVYARNAAEALARLEACDIDLVFSDIVMPGAMDGYALAREIRARRPQMPIVLTTGYADLAPKAGIEFAVLRKPFQLAALDQVMRESLRRSRAWGRDAADA